MNTEVRQISRDTDVNDSRISNDGRRSAGTERRRFAGAIAILAIASGFTLIGGCGSENASNTASDQRQTTAQTKPDDQIPEPAVVVSQFLDRVRRGGSDADASDLLTKLARQEMTRIGRPLQFPGSPDTTFRVGQTVRVPDQNETVWVQTILSEPIAQTESGTTTMDYEVVWSLRSESNQWRITGFAVDQGAELPPMLIDFENGDEMEARLSALETENATSNR